MGSQKYDLRVQPQQYSCHFFLLQDQVANNVLEATSLSIYLGKVFGIKYVV